ncbi:MAG TPA: histidine phosphatase family protein [Patescibacteria group bacterium]|nr:histidine phosphatase family protein [Patescibacteria group bacterium]
MKHLYFVRHGLSVMNKRGVFSGRTETPLDPEGIEQAHEAGRKAKDLNIDVIVSSPLERCRETAKIIAEEIDYPVEDIRYEELFVERELGSLEGTPFHPHIIDHGHDGVESGEAILERARRGVEHLRLLPGDNVLLVSHGAIGRAIRHILHPEVPYHGSERFENAKVVQLL